MNYRVTFREVLVSIIIILLLGAVGVIIDSKITDVYIENTSVYKKSLKIRDEDSLNYLMSTKAGNSLIEGEFKSNKGVTFKELKGSYTYIRKVKEVYTMHSRLVCKTVGSGKNSHEVCHTEYYWSWDYHGSDEKYAKNITFLEQSLNTKHVVSQVPDKTLKLKDNLSDKNSMKLRENYLYKSSNVRYYYEYIPLNFKGTIFTSFNDDKKCFNQYQIKYNQTIDQLLEYESNSVNIFGIIFKIAWLVLIGSTVYLYVIRENEYLEN